MLSEEIVVFLLIKIRERIHLAKDLVSAFVIGKPWGAGQNVDLVQAANE